jgi:adenylate cyclase
VAGFRGDRRSVIDWPARILLAVVTVSANVAGTAVVALLALFLIPRPKLVDTDQLRMLNAALIGVYLVTSIPLASLWIGFGVLRARSADPRAERRLVLYGPLRITLVQAVFWLGGVALFGGFNATYSVRLGLAVGQTVLIGGVATCALSYLVAERILRHAATRVLAGDPYPRRYSGGVLVRFVLFWVLGTAVPIGGLLGAAVGELESPELSPADLAVLVLAVGGITLGTGFLTTIGAARAVADPVRAVHGALRRVEQGDLDVAVPVYDGTELGQLQAGFNTMAAGLRERDHLRDLFGRQVGHDVASAAAAASEVRLGGETRTVAVLFVDLIGSTTLAARRPPSEVVAVLNEFFGVVVGVVEGCGGWINKFEGDAALAVFGAPNHMDDPAGRALAAARELATRLPVEVPDVVAGIGVSAGEAVAGYIGDPRRYEYTVIGDPVNEAARLTELAKSAPWRVLAAERALAMAGAEADGTDGVSGEAGRWTLGEEVTLRGRDHPTRLASPSRPGGASDAELTASATP